jgi:hypothetical protein
MINHMNKHINTLSLDTVKVLETKEHGLSKAPSNKELLSMEAKEHGKKMTMSQLLKVESKEHKKPEDNNDEEEDDDDEEENGQPAYQGLGALIIKSKGK